MSSDVGVGSPVVLLGIDGLSFDFLNAPMVQGVTPNLKELLRQSKVATLRSTAPPFTGPAWTTIMTGVDPGRHGVFSFTDATGRPITDASVAAARLWDYVSEAGGRSIVVNVPITHPPRTVGGYLVSGMPVPPGSAFTYPSTLAGELENMGYVVDVAVQEERQQEGVAALGKLTRMTEARGRALVHLARTRTWDLLVAVFVLPDRLGHPWWKQLVPGDPLYDTRAARRVRRRARACVAALDHAVGELMASVPPHASVLLCSDHGFGPLQADVFFDRVLAEAGLIEGAARGGARDVLLRLGRSRAARLAPAALHRWGRDRVSSGATRRRAWTAPSYELGVRLADPDDAEACDLVVELLERLRGPDGSRPVARAVRRAELHHGAHVGEAPDVVCEMADESVGLHEGLHATRPWVSRSSTTWGTHRSDGVIALHGAPCRELKGALVADVAPTILALLGLAVDGLDGRSLIERPAPRVLAGRFDRSEGNRSGAPAYSPEQEAAVLEHLKGLGYVD